MLFSRTVDEIEALPSAKRARYEPYIGHWWAAVMAPDHQWNASASGQTPVISSEHLALLATAGDVIEATLEGSPAAPGAFSADQLLTQSQAWIDELERDPSLISSNAMRQTLIQQLQHLQWLVQNAEMFGAARVARVGQEVIGALALATPEVPKEKRGRFSGLVKDFIGAVIVFTSLVTVATPAIEASGAFAAAAITAVDGVVEAVDDARDDDGAPESEDTDSSKSPTPRD
jgi:hypothetical protein